ncbi:hypothetical protein HZZ13_10080 [Bradyrhizobium sp. CNPSo 4010]|uniref:Secreted protein n=1 Tax=Bradyrhizobium agreste TaxID=2751811 RepID=A0ABS0PLV6_9BRAD|nr:hypothetical protein [Bradyrhizobium agreste]MBH5398138.1 hypothetical protein [Bradyrhizobium agreste]
MFGFTCMPLCSFFESTRFAQWTVGASRHPAFPAPSALLRVVNEQSSGGLCRENASLCQPIDNSFVPRTLRSTK